jgi:serine/threonine protein kinase
VTALESLHPLVKTGDIVEGRYRIIRLISEGGMSSVFLAEHVLIKRRVAVKLLREDLADDGEAVERFMNEASTAGTLGHPSIVESTDMGFTRDGIPFIVFEYLEGATLTEEIYRVGGMGVHRVCRIAVQITSALQAAHESGIVHGDLKTDNIFLCTRGDYPDHVKVLDFGASRFQGEVRHKIIGTPEYLAPEQILHPDNVDRRVDIHALGLVIYEMLTARRAFASDGDIDELLRRIVRDPPARLSPNHAPPSLQALLFDNLLAKNPDDRPATMADVEKLITEIAGQSRPSGSIPPLSRTIEINPRVTPLPSKTITNLAPPPARTLDTDIPASLRPRSPSSSNPGLVPPPEPSPAPAPIQLPSEAPASMVSLPFTPSPSRAWLVLVVVSLLALAAGVATWFAGQTTTVSSSTQGLQLHADKLTSALEQAVGGLRLRAESVASSPVLRAAVETDAATLKDMLRDRDFVFVARDHETLELFANKASLLRIPETASALQATDHAELRLRGDKIMAHTGVRVGSSGLLVLAAPVDLATVRNGLPPTVSATLLGFDKPHLLRERTEPGASEEQRFPITVGDAKWTGTLVLTVPASTSATVDGYQALRLPLFGVAGVSLVLGLVLLLRRRR